MLIYSALPRPNCERLGPKPNETTIVIAAVFALAGLVKGVTGLGLPTISMGLLATVMTLAMNHGMAGALTPAIASPTLTAAPSLVLEWGSDKRCAYACGPQSSDDGSSSVCCSSLYI